MIFLIDYLAVGIILSWFTHPHIWSQLKTPGVFTKAKLTSVVMFLVAILIWLPLVIYQIYLERNNEQ